MLWEGDDFEWVSKDANGRSGGLIVIWKKGSFEMLANLVAQILWVLRDGGKKKK